MLRSRSLGTQIAAQLLFIVVWSVAAWAAQNPTANDATPAKVSSQDRYVGNQACARCHAAIYESYQRTSMARASGPAMDGFMPAEFTHKESGVHYRIYAENGRAWLNFDRPGDPDVQRKARAALLHRLRTPWP